MRLQSSVISTEKALQKNPTKSLDKRLQARQANGRVQMVRRAQSYQGIPGRTCRLMAWDEWIVSWLLRPSMVCQTVQVHPALAGLRPHSPPAGIDQGYTQGPAVTRRAALGRVLLWLYLNTMPTNVLTLARQRGSSFTRTSGLSSAPLRSGSVSPTVF